MSVKPPVLKGVVRGGVIVYEAPWPLPDGTEVEFTITRHVFTAEERAEFEAWDKLSDEALQPILNLERQVQESAAMS
jgi:hypothetical protein